MIDIDDPQLRAMLTRQMYVDLDLACKEIFKDDPRTYMGASQIGGECSAQIWNDFRWLKFENLSGQKLRLFNRGHLEEPRFVSYLTQMGFEIKEFDLATGEQFGIMGCDGHFGGHLDGLAKPPARYMLSSDLIFLSEYKTHSEKSFTKLAGKKEMDSQWNLKPRIGGEGMKASKPQHYKQMCCYGRAYSLQYGLYVAVNKDTDEIYFEIVELDWNLADDMFRKADGFIKSQVQPMKIAMTETFWLCKGCVHIGICHRKEIPQKNCRSCIHAYPVANSEWVCNRPIEPIGEGADEKLTKEKIKIGCDFWKPIINAA